MRQTHHPSLDDAKADHACGLHSIPTPLLGTIVYLSSKTIVEYARERELVYDLRDAIHVMTTALATQAGNITNSASPTDGRVFIAYVQLQTKNAIKGKYVSQPCQVAGR